MKLISTYVATIIIALVTLAIGYFVYVWYSQLFQKTSEEVRSVGEKQVSCQFGSFVVLTETLNCTSKFLNFSLKNNGYIDLYNLRVVIFDGIKMHTLNVYDENGNIVDINNPLKPNTVNNYYVNISGISRILSLEFLTQCANVNIKIRDLNLTCQ
ncbi:MAG: hypothetical protein QXH68_01815 [Candidatus Aenigmatarchaeota archaeon]